MMNDIYTRLLYSNVLRSLMNEHYIDATNYVMTFKVCSVCNSYVHMILCVFLRTVV